MITTSTIELSRKAVKSNIRFLRSIVGDKVKIASVVKSNAYGHGIEEIVPVFEANGIDVFAVFSSNEAYRVLKVIRKKNTRIIIMGYIGDEDVDWVIENNIECYVFDSPRCNKLAVASKKAGKKAIIHLDLETGMNRTGLNYEDMQKAIHIIKANEEQFHIAGICTHFAGAESIANYVRIQDQISRFVELVKYLNSLGIKSDTLHAACSAAAVSYPETHFDMVRVGIMQYGFWPSKETLIQYIHNKKNKRDPLKRILRWKTSVMDVKSVEQGEFIGYGTFYQADKNMIIALVPVGYHNGFSRSLSNNGKVLINKQRVSVIGMVNMNMIVCDVSRLENIKIGDEVVLIGKQGRHELTVSSFSELSNLVNYELLTRLPLDINRTLI